MKDTTQVGLGFTLFAILAIVANLALLAAGIWVVVWVLRAMGVLA